MSASGEPQHVCFYSNKCRWSEGFIKAISQTPYKHEVRFICVDPKADGSRIKLPAWLKKVPTLVIKGEDEPRVDGNVMNWLSERKVMSKGPSSEASEPEPWVGGEMGGSYTKGFSFIAGGDLNEAPEGNFSFLNGASSVATKTASDIPGGGLGARGQQKSKKEDLFDKQMESYMQQRGSGMPPPVMRS